MTRQEIKEKVRSMLLMAEDEHSASLLIAGVLLGHCTYSSLVVIFEDDSRYAAANLAGHGRIVVEVDDPELDDEDDWSF